MIKRLIFAGLLALSMSATSSLLFAQSGGSTGATSSGGTSTQSTSGTSSTRETTTTGQTRGTEGKLDAKHFVINAMQDGMAEVQLGQLAKSRATRADVKAFAGMMVEEHTRANDELQAMAAAKKITMPKDAGTENKKKAVQLKKITAKNFDKAYINAMVKDHEKAVKLFQQASTDLDDAELKAWAARTLPTLQRHLEQAQAMKGGTNNQKVGTTGGTK